MPSPQERQPEQPADKSLEQVIGEDGLYPVEAFDFVHRGLMFTTDQLHAAITDPNESRHISGQQLCEGLRQYALLQWGLLARTVLHRWNITRTEDFGAIVYMLIKTGVMGKTEEDTFDDFREVYDFTAAFEQGYAIPAQSLETLP
jgi:uncharacterized repeat protein (TIGR04138 family)